MISFDMSYLILAIDVLITMYAIEKAQQAYSIFWALFAATLSGVLVMMFYNGSIVTWLSGGVVPMQDAAMAFICLFLAGFQGLLFIVLVYGTLQRMAEVNENAEEEDDE